MIMTNYETLAEGFLNRVTIEGDIYYEAVEIAAEAIKNFAEEWNISDEDELYDKACAYLSLYRVYPADGDGMPLGVAVAEDAEQASDYILNRYSVDCSSDDYMLVEWERIV